MIEIIPAIMPDNYDDLLEKAGRVKGTVAYAQIDVMDGKFVPSVSWPYDKKGKSQFKSMIQDGVMLPFWDEISYEVDLMVTNPEQVVEDWVALGVRRIIVHIESTKKIKEISSILENRFSREEDFTGIPPIEFGVALGANTSFDAIYPYANDIDFVQFMGIKKIGYQGEPFNKEVVTRIENLRAQCPHLIISVDGGVNFETAPALIKAGSSRLVSGSTIFESADIRETIHKLKQKI